MVCYTNKWQIPFQIDEADYLLVIKYTWNINRGYVRCSAAGRLHNILLGPAPEGMEWDHENRDRLDNRRKNLRLVTAIVNRRNKTPRHDNTTGISGVCWKEDMKRWRATLSNKHLGYFPTVEEAIQARRKAEIKYWAKNGRD